MLLLQPRQRRRVSKNLSGGTAQHCSARGASINNSDCNPDITASGIHSPSPSHLSSSSLSSSQDRQACELLDNLVMFNSLDAPKFSNNDLWLDPNSAEALVSFNDVQPQAGSLRSDCPDDAIGFPSDSWPGRNPAEAPDALDAFQRPISDRRLDSMDNAADRPSLSSAETLNTLTGLQPPTRDPQPRRAIGLLTAAAGQSFDIDEGEIELLMQFIGETFALQHASYRAASTMQRSWLLLLLMRSPTFYYASLSMSAYHHYLSLSGDNQVRVSIFQAYQKYRTYALSGFRELLESDQISVPSPGSVPGECMICGVQIALLEVRNPTFSFSAEFVSR